MPVNFDPYHAWLGIPKGTRPLNHYQLLGLKPFTTEPPVIAEAAESQTGKVKPYLSGPQGSTARLVIDEIAAARGVLLNAATRRTYDAQLRKEMGIAEAPAAAPRPAAAATVQRQSAARMAPVAKAQTPMPAVAMPVAVANPVIPAAVAAPAAMPMQAAVPVQAAIPAQHVAQAINIATAMPVGGPGFPSTFQDASAGPVIRKTVRRRKSNPTAMIVIVAVIILGASGALTYVFRNELSAAFDRMLGGNQTAQQDGDLMDAGNVPKSGIRVVRKGSSADTAPGERQYTDAPGNVDGQGKADEIANRFGAAMQDFGSTENMKKPDEAEMTEKKFGFRPDMNTVTKENSNPVKTTFTFPGTKAAPEETETVSRNLALVRTALGNRDQAKAQELLDLAYLDAVSGDSLMAVDRTRQLVEIVAAFWGAVTEGTKALTVAAEITAGDTVAIVTEIEGDKLGLRVNGQNKDYSLSKLPTGLARAIAERWLNADDENTPMIIAAFLAVDPKGNIDEARDLLSKAREKGANVEDMRREFDEIKK